MKLYSNKKWSLNDLESSKWMINKSFQFLKVKKPRSRILKKKLRNLEGTTPKCLNKINYC